MNYKFYRFFQFSKFFLIQLILLLNIFIASGQTITLDAFIDSAKLNNADLIVLTKTVRYKTLEIEQIKAENNKPKMFLSADYLFAPYFNNNGQVVTINPSSKAIGYDIGITNGGLYSALYNIEYPLFNRKQTSILISEKENDMTQINLQAELLRNELEHKITNQFYEAWRSMITYQYAVQNIEFLNKQLDIVKQLTSKGIFKYVDYKLMEIELHSNSIQLEKLKSDYKSNLSALRKDCGIADISWVLLDSSDITLQIKESSNPIFLKSYSNDSLSAVIQQNVFNCRYKPQIHVYANTGLNAVTINDIQRRFGIGAGLQFTYTFYDGNQKSINTQLQQIRINQASELKLLKIKELRGQKIALKNNIESAQENLIKEKEIISEYENVISICLAELQKAQISIIDFLNINRNFYEKKLNYALHKIDLNILINEYNYWEH